jgi:hypothetical protein
MKTPTLPLAFACISLLTAAACGGAEPRPATATVARPAPAPAPPPPRLAGACAEPPALAECAPADRSCATENEERALAWRDWQLSCRPVLPADPIAGEAIEVNVPYPPSTDGPCTAGGTSFALERGAEVTVIRVRDVAHGRCERMSGLSVVSLGALPPGAYRVDTGYWQTSFVVRPPGSDPGDLPEALRAAIAVAEQHTPGLCFGMPGDEPHLPAAAFAGMRVSAQMKKAFPGRTAQELLGLYQGATAISVTPAGPGEWRYAYADGACCTISAVEGTLRRQGDRWIVGPAAIVDSKTVPC